ncbi:hypothetical protein HPB50_013739 [Hyalomma asiaticum]|uniref:Uncharacterized protein n=1 Tax=Hyalomma asiaticum TaxID=266040 RepID=A0ACB7SF88_HYAAI|nr:hypothetical protein HPB50_013739 [Hyalomma asiaticum]
MFPTIFQVPQEEEDASEFCECFFAPVRDLLNTSRDTNNPVGQLKTTLQMARALTEFNGEDKHVLTARANNHWLEVENTNDSPLNATMIFQYTEIKQCDHCLVTTAESQATSILRLPTTLGTLSDCLVQKLLDHFFHKTHEDSDDSTLMSPCAIPGHRKKTRRVILSKNASTIVVKTMCSVFDPKQRDVVKLKNIVANSDEISLPLRFDEHQIYSLRSIVLHAGMDTTYLIPSTAGVAGGTASTMPR